MFHKHFFGVIAVAAFVLAVTVSTSAQVGELRGHVFMQQADGQKVPLADAQIDVFRTDIKGEYKTKTNKRGEFVFAGLPFIGTYTVAASHPTAAPALITGVKVGRDQQADIIVTPGDGKRLTAEEIKANAASSNGGGAAPAAGNGGGTNSGSNTGESAADKAKREELIRKNKEIEEGNRKIAESNAVVSKSFKAGNDALLAASAAIKASNSPEAIAKYTEAINLYAEGLAADPDQPALLTNKALALKARGVENYNASIKMTDDAQRQAAIQSSQADFKMASEDSTKAVTLLKAVPTPTDAAEQQRLNANKYAAFSTHAEAMRLYATKGDPTQADAALEAFKDYIAVETDPAKKAKAQLDAAQMLLDAGAADKALAEYQSILSTQPDNVDANLGAGLAIYATGDKNKFQEAANYLQHFVDVAPDSHKFKQSAKEILTELKNTEKVVPEKTAPAKRKKP
ncbi:MAG TPA: carboxypeptidase regulatory-like domain-containing protein [Pyrinomonadaceae bacterium]